MLIEYYKSNDLAYANRKRYKTFNYVADASETQKAIKLGDGATTSIKTSASNICNYVIITQTADDNTIIQKTRWYVTYYTYLNGGQIELFLQRDVIGELGLDGMFGKIERGYTETLLRNRKELSLNQILKSRLPLISENDTYGNYEVNSHSYERWGIIYLTKPTKVDPQTGQSYAYSDTPTINIPAFTPSDVNYTYISNNTNYVVGFNGYDDVISFIVKVRNKYYLYIASLRPALRSFGGELVWDISSDTLSELNYTPTGYIEFDLTWTQATEERIKNALWNAVRNMIGNYHQEKWLVPDDDAPNVDYNGKCIKDPDNVGSFLQYTVIHNSININLSNSDLVSYITYSLSVTAYVTSVSDVDCTVGYSSYTNQLVDNYTYITLSGGAAGNLTIDLNEGLIDEPYVCYVFPLYNVTITDKRDNSKTYTINETDAFDIFNTVVEACSGENSYLIDAQIYPYCPELVDVACYFEPTANKKYPFFSISNTSFIRKVNVQLKPYKDIKKEYIKRDYFIVSPEQSSNYHFNFYDYTNDIEEVAGDELYNYKKLEISIKTALKPMNIIASAVISPTMSSLKGFTFPSDLKGCQPTSNGFECSLSTNHFQEYIRNNSNYQAIFALQKEELQKTHDVEKVNDITSTIVNTTTATAMGAIGGMAMGSAGAASIYGTKAIAAGIGASVAGGTVGTAMTIQAAVNEQLRQYEEKLLQQRFDLEIGTIKNIPNTVSRISSFNEIIMQEFYFVIETYECSEQEGIIADTFIDKYAYGLGIFGRYEDFERDTWFLRGTLITSNLLPALHNVASKELNGGIYYYE